MRVKLQKVFTIVFSIPERGISAAYCVSLLVCRVVSLYAEAPCAQQQQILVTRNPNQLQESLINTRRLIWLPESLATSHEEASLVARNPNCQSQESLSSYNKGRLPVARRVDWLQESLFCDNEGSSNIELLTNNTILK